MNPITLDRNEAIEGGAGLGMRIIESGAYTGTFTLAEVITAKTGAVGVEFTFESDQGQIARYLTVYTQNAAGENIFGYKQLQAIMACAKVRQITPAINTVMKYDPAWQKETPQQIEVIPELTNIPIGLVLQKELYTKNNGDTGEKMSLFGFFNAESRQTSAELLNNEEAKTIDNMLLTLKDKDSRNSTRPSVTGNGQTPSTPVGSTSDFDDDIPF